jgi:Zn-dependent protease with chaperone function
MSTLFFERQEAQRSYTKWLVWGFIVAILLVVAVINLVVLLGFGGDLERAWDSAPGLFIGTTVLVAGTILCSSWYKSSQLRAGGAVVARSLGGVAVTSNDADLKRKRLLNIVEEMAIAARIRKPQVFVLPGEQGINAFAAGHSPDEAAVAVTQGALDHLDRDQLQAVIGHEFSHILNGDMRINMRLTAWIFGLYVITDVARRLMRGRSRGRDAARLKAVAFGVFIAGSVGMLAGRLLQAAVSRRREHLADASAVQFTRNPGALQGAFVVMAAHAGGTRLTHENSADVAHMFFAGSDPAWANKVGGRWFATHPPIEERVRALDSRLTPLRFKALVSDERRKLLSTQQAAAPPASAAAPPASAVAPLDAPDTPVTGLIAEADPAPPAPAPSTSMTTGALSLVDTSKARQLGEPPAPGIRSLGGRPLPPDVLRNRLLLEQQNAIIAFTGEVEHKPVAVQAAYIATMLASEPAKWRMQLTRLAPVLGIELFKETQAQIPRIAALTPAARLPLLTDLLSLLDALDPADRKRLRGIARAFAPTVAAADMLRYSVTRILDRRLAKPAEQGTPVPLTERAAQVCEVYAAVALCRSGPGKQGQNAYRAGLMGMLPPPQWLPCPEAAPALAALDAALTGLAQVHPTGKKSFSEGLARVMAVGGKLTVPQVDLVRGVCHIVDCQLPMLPEDVVYEDERLALRVPQASAR